MSTIRLSSIPFAEVRPLDEEENSPELAPGSPSQPHVEEGVKDEESAVAERVLGGKGNNETDEEEENTGAKGGMWILIAIIVAGLVALGGGIAVGLVVTGSDDDNETRSIGPPTGPNSPPTSAVAPTPLSLPSAAPTTLPTLLPTLLPTSVPTSTPTLAPAGQPSTAPSLSSSTNCQPLLQDYVDCRDANLDPLQGSTCSSCFVQYINVTGAQQCLVWTQDFCNSIPTPRCQCGECVDSLYALSNCYLGNKGCVGDCDALN